MNFAFSSPAENLEAASAAWLRDLEAQGRLSRTVEAYASTLADFTSFFCADEDKSDIPSYAEVLIWRGNLESRGCKERTIAQYLRQLRAFFDWACEHGWYQANPVLKRLIPSVSDLPPAEYVALHDWQLQRLYTFNRPQNAKATTYPRNYAIVIMLLTTDLRNGDLLHLTPADLHWSDNVIAARDGHTGEGRWHFQTLPSPPSVSIWPAAFARKIYPTPRPCLGTPRPRVHLALAPAMKAVNGSTAPVSGSPRWWRAMSRPWPSLPVCAARSCVMLRLMRSHCRCRRLVRVRQVEMPVCWSK